MKPTSLKPGDQVICSGRRMEFIRRDRQPCRAAVNVLRCDDYRGLNGPADDGTCHMTDHYLSRNVARATAVKGGV